MHFVLLRGRPSTGKYFVTVTSVIFNLSKQRKKHCPSYPPYQQTKYAVSNIYKKTMKKLPTRYQRNLTPTCPACNVYKIPDLFCKFFQTVLFYLDCAHTQKRKLDKLTQVLLSKTNNNNNRHVAASFA